MRSFEWIDATSVEHAATLLSGSNAKSQVLAKAGGTDLLDLMKEGIVSPARLVNLKSIPELNHSGIAPSGEYALGALTTLAKIAASPEIRQRYRALAEAADHAATPQVRNAATIGGNLLQKPRCWYFRSEYFHREDASSGESRKERRGESQSQDPARSGQNQYHSIFDNKETSLVHASTPATALAAYDAKIELVGRGGKKRLVPIRQFFLPPTMSGGRETVIEAGEVLTQVLLPALPAGSKAAYHKQTERESYDWPICDVAVVLRMEGQTVRAASISLGWVAPTPRLAVESERLLIGKSINESVAAEAAKAAVSGATPLSKNAYKVPILEAIVRRTILAAANS